MYRVLIVDDERSIRNGLKNIVPWQEYGFFDVLTAANGQEALEILEGTHCDLVITDLKMPIIDGVSLIREIYNRKYDTISIILSGYQDFGSAKEALKYNVSDYLLKPVDRNELLECVNVIKNRLDEKNNKAAIRSGDVMQHSELFYNLMRGKLDYAEHKEQLLTYKISEEMSFCVAMIQVVPNNQLGYLDMSEINQINRQICETVKVTVGELFKCEMYDESKNVICLLCYGDKGQLDANIMENCLNKIYLNIYKVVNVSPYITYGRTAEHYDDITHSWKQARLALERELMSGSTKVVSYDMVLLDEKEALNIKWENKQLLSAIENNNNKLINQEITSLTEEITRTQLSKKIVRAILYNLLLDISKVLKKHGGELNDLPEYAQYRAYIDAGNYSDMQVWLTNMCEAVTEYMQKLLATLISGVVYRMQQYVHQNYSSEMTLQSIAAKFYVNPSYLGRLFKKTFGVSFNEYLNKYRISQVKLMLKNQQGKISEIIEKSGYSNPEYFYRQFKKYEGISFMQYRENLKIQNEI